MAWWQTLSALQQVFWVLAILSSTFFLISTLVSLLGFDGFETDIDAEPLESSTGEILEFLSFRNLVAFVLGFSWTGVLFYPKFQVFSLLLALLVGLGFAWMNHRLMKKLRGLESSGNSNLNEAIGQDAKVSVQIDGKMQGKGKVVVRVGNREMELLAATEDMQSLKRGDMVQVYGIEDNIVLVSKEDKLGIRLL
jgi:membrane protein implicated in regulation of membrane protease activity